MYLNIADERIVLDVDSAQQDFVREVEKGVNEIFRRFRLRYPSKANKEILAMVAYQYASFYSTLKERYDHAAEDAEECLRLIDEDLRNGADDFDDDAY
ncbi:MAG: cell division protein ZapA [Muribaculaceae bacterium]|nr:cell division protein ZapA [Muribaculaceae bacterium]